MYGDEARYRMPELKVRITLRGNEDGAETVSSQGSILTPGGNPRLFEVPQSSISTNRQRACFNCRRVDKLELSAGAKSATESAQYDGLTLLCNHAAILEDLCLFVYM